MGLRAPSDYAFPLVPHCRVWPQLTESRSVTSYSMATGTLTLEHQYPPGSKTRALVDVKLLLDRLKSDQTQVGEWVNVIGYIAADPALHATTPTNQRGPDVHVQALVVWSAGPLDIEQYEACLCRGV